MSHFARYLKERENVDTLETNEGFAIYLITGQECYLRDIYVIPEHRKGGVATKIADQVADLARSLGCKYMTGSVDVRANGATDSVKVLLAYGMKLHRTVDNGIIFMKDL